MKLGGRWHLVRMQGKPREKTRAESTPAERERYLEKMRGGTSRILMASDFVK